MALNNIIGAATKIAEFLRLVESVDSKVTKLLHQSLKSALSNLEYAQHSNGQNQIEYIKQARVEFNQAVNVEEDENKILALTGLSICQSLLGDKGNASVTYNRISQVELSLKEMAKYTAIDVAAGWGGLAGGYLLKKMGLRNAVTFISSRQDTFRTVKQSALSMARKYL